MVRDRCRRRGLLGTARALISIDGAHRPRVGTALPLVADSRDCMMYLATSEMRVWLRANSTGVQATAQQLDSRACHRGIMPSFTLSHRDGVCLI